MQKDADSSLDEICIARLLEERGLKLQDKVQDLTLTIMEFKIKNTKSVNQNSDSVDIKFSKRLGAVREELEQYNLSVDKLQKTVLERYKYKSNQKGKKKK